MAMGGDVMTLRGLTPPPMIFRPVGAKKFKNPVGVT